VVTNVGKRCETHLCRLFRVIDRDNSGFLESPDLEAFLNTVSDEMGSNNKDGIQRLMVSLDKDGNPGLSLEDFLIAFPRISGTLADGTSPDMVHLSFNTEWTLGVVVMWVTSDPTNTSTVDFGKVSSVLDQHFEGSTHTYTAGGWKGVIHEANFPQLEPATKYYYRVGDALGGWSAIFSFTTPPLPGTVDKPQIFGVFGDMGTAIPLGYKVCEQMEKDNENIPFNALLHVGDISYASVAMTSTVAHGDDDSGDEVELVWDLWEKQVEPLAANIPYVTGVGNHERFYNYSAYLNRFRNPSPWGGDPSHIADAVFWFGIDYGIAHFTFMSTEHSYDPGSSQYIWLEKELASVNRTRTPWLFLTGHRPIYSSDKSEQDSHWPGAHFQQTIEPLMLKYNVDAYFCGHMHMYERIHPVRNGTVVQTGNVYHNPGAPMHVVQGTSGIFEDTKFVDPQPAWSAVRAGKLGYGRMHIENRTHMFYEFMYLQTNKAYDSFWITK